MTAPSRNASRIAHNAAIDYMRRNSVNQTSIEAENADGSYQIQIESLTQEVDRLRKDGKEKDEKIERLNREIGKWQAMYEMIKDQQDDE